MWGRARRMNPAEFSGRGSGLGVPACRAADHRCGELIWCDRNFGRRHGPNRRCSDVDQLGLERGGVAHDGQGQRGTTMVFSAPQTCSRSKSSLSAPVRSPWSSIGRPRLRPRSKMLNAAQRCCSKRAAALGLTARPTATGSSTATALSSCGHGNNSGRSTPTAPLPARRRAGRPR
jgi:hypothetical protein